MYREKQPVLPFSGLDAIKMDVQPKCLAVGPGGYTVVVCIGQVSIKITDLFNLYSI